MTALQMFDRNPFLEQIPLDQRVAFAHALAPENFSEGGIFVGSYAEYVGFLARIGVEFAEFYVSPYEAEPVHEIAEVFVRPEESEAAPTEDRFSVEGKNGVRYEVESVKGSPELAASVGGEILAMHERIFEPVYEANDPARYSVLDDGPTFRRYMTGVRAGIAENLSSGDNEVILLREGDRIVGIMYAAPARPDERIMYDVEEEIPDEQYAAMQAQTATIWLTMIDEEHRGNGGWRPMIDTLYGRIREAGYTYVSTFVRTENNYAEKVATNPGGEIIRREATAAIYDGDLIFFRVKLGDEAAAVDEQNLSGDRGTEVDTVAVRHAEIARPEWRISPQVSGDGRRIAYDLPGGERVVAEFTLADHSILVDGEMESRQIIVTRTVADGSENQTAFWRTYRTSERLEDLDKYPTGFFSEANFPGRVVEIATGDGALVKDLRAMGVDAHGIDIWLDDRQMEDPDFSLGLATHTGMPDESADHVIINNMINHLREDHNWKAVPGDYEKQILAEAYRILRPGGRLIIHPAWQNSRRYYDAMIGDLHFTVPDNVVGVNDPYINKGPIILQKAE